MSWSATSWAITSPGCTASSRSPRATTESRPVRSSESRTTTHELDALRRQRRVLVTIPWRVSTFAESSWKDHLLLAAQMGDHQGEPATGWEIGSWHPADSTSYVR